MQKIRIKVCGMKYPDNIKKLVKLPIDFIGFNFYDKSPRYLNEITDDILKLIPDNIKKVGVFVNAELDDVIDIKKKYALDFVQLHGMESPGYCKYLYVHGIKIIKAFQIIENFDFFELNDYEKYCSYFLFDNKSNAYGGSGKKFNWDILKKFDNTKLPYFLSGGIDLEDVDDIEGLKCFRINIFGVDINSKFETVPGRKDVKKIAEFINKMK
jgi:phosphoribosylanthranilate isomerase